MVCKEAGGTGGGEGEGREGEGEGGERYFFELGLGLWHCDEERGLKCGGGRCAVVALELRVKKK